jgi:hypothetical protein
LLDHEVFFIQLKLHIQVILMAQNYIIFFKKLTVVRLYFFSGIALLNNQLESNP